MAEDDGAKGLFAALFDAKPKAKRAAKAGPIKARGRVSSTTDASPA